MLHYTRRATRNMSKATYFYAFKFFLPTFFCCDTETTALHMLTITPVSLHPLFIHTQLLSPVLHLDCKPQREARQTQQHHCPLQGLGTNSCVCIYKPMLHHCHSGGQVAPNPRFQQEPTSSFTLFLNQGFLMIPSFQRTKRKPTLKRSERINGTALWCFASSCTSY